MSQQYASQEGHGFQHEARVGLLSLVLPEEQTVRHGILGVLREENTERFDVTILGTFYFLRGFLWPCHLNVN